MAAGWMRDLIAEELAAYPGLRYEFGNGGKHPFVIITTPSGRSIRLAYPNTPSDHRAWLNQRASLRQSLRKLGVERRAPQPA